MRPQRRSCAAALLLLVAAPLLAAEPSPPGTHGKIELIYDRWGIPHVFSDTDEGAMYGLGWATAEHRGFQMHYSLRIIQGRLAEVVGAAPKLRRRETAVDNDRKMRTFGFHRAAQAAASKLDAETAGLLAAYCRGVNDWFAANPREHHPLLAKLGLRPEPWTPADCIVSWWHLAQFFATDGTRDLLSWRNLTNPRPGRPEPPAPGPLWVDDAAAVVGREDVSDKWVAQTEALLRTYGIAPAEGPASRPAGPKFSHAWVVAGKKTTTGSAILVSDPQTPVRNPSLWQEFHVSGKTFNARGVGIPGCPGILLGFSTGVAWGVTALGADQADLFRLKTDPNRPDQYCFDGTWRKMTVRREEILVKGGRAEPLTVRETHLGPVVTAFAFARPGDPQVALKRVPICSPNGAQPKAWFAMARAAGAKEFHRALAGWEFPTANVLFGDRRGEIGYSVVGAIPIRSAAAKQRGRAAMDGWESGHDWQGYVPHDLKPHVLNPKQGWLASGNHRPIASFYRVPIGAMTGWGGHSLRSWRLYERLRGRERFRPADVLAIHFDCVNPARREIARLGLHARDVLQRELSSDAAVALKRLEPWLKAGAGSDLRIEGSETAMELSTFFRFVATPLAGRYGGGYSGLARFLRHARGRIDADPKAPLDAQELAFVDQALAQARRQCADKYGRDAAQWNRLAREAVTKRRLGWFESLDGFGSPDASGNLTYPPLDCVDTGTIISQGGQSYTQYVPLHDVDAAQAVQPIGHSDRKDAASRTSTMELWSKGKLHPAPLTRKAVNRIAASRRTLGRS